MVADNPNIKIPTERPKKSWDWVEYASEQESIAKKEARSYDRQGYKEMALVYAGRCMALQEMLEAGGYPECVTNKSMLT